MQGIGSGENGQLTFLDFVALISLWIGFLNLEENLTQGDKQDLMQKLDKQTDDLLKEIHTHLEEQDKKIDRLLALLEGVDNGVLQE